MGVSVLNRYACFHMGKCVTLQVVIRLQVLFGIQKITVTGAEDRLLMSPDGAEEEYYDSII